jgi:threonine dehydratase
MPPILDLTDSEIASAAKRIATYVRVTPTVRVEGSSFELGFPFVLKLEQLQHAGSFKARGAFLNLLTREVPNAGVVAASGGNHGAAVAYAAQRLGIPATIFVPTISNPAKIAAIRAAGARLVVTGARYADALAASVEHCAATGAMPVHAFDDIHTVCGQATLALELERQHPEVQTILVPVGGAGLIGGIAAHFRRRVRVIGVEPVGSPTLARALEAGEPVDAPTEGIAADSLAPKRVGVIPFGFAQRFVQRVVLVEDEAIRASQTALWRNLRVIAEPGGAAAFAALLSGAYRPEPGERVAAIISGGNTDLSQFPQ